VEYAKKERKGLFVCFMFATLFLATIQENKCNCRREACKVDVQLLWYHAIRLMGNRGLEAKIKTAGPRQAAKDF